MLVDLKFIIWWWLVIFGLGLVSFPLIFLTFKNFFDKAYIFSKIFTPIIISFFLLLLGVLKILPFSLFSIYLLIFVLIIIDFICLFKNKNYLLFFNFFKKNYKILILEEILFLVILTIWSFIRGFAPNIEGLEKYMDWGFINSILRSDFLPPQDMWFAGSSINYYYFGHLIFAILTKISGISSSITYNLSIATVCALTFVGTFSLSSNLVFSLIKKIGFKKIILAGFISAFLLTFGGNLHTVYKLTQNYTHKDKISTNYWYPDATRFIGYDPATNDKTIHEFPIYSFVVSDLHGHMNDIPIVLFFMAFLFHSFLVYSPKFLNWKFIIGSGFILSINYMTNAWDFAVYGILLAIFTLFINIKNNSKNYFYKTVFNGTLVIVFWYIFSLPFSQNFNPMMQGIRISDSHSPFYQLLILYGGFWLICFPFYIYSLFKKKLSTADLFVIGLILTATILVLIPEFFYIKDIYIYEYRRANTMFKLVYQAFILYSLSSGYILIRLSQTKSKFLLSIYKIFFSIIFVSQLIYPYFAIKSYYSFKTYQGLNGLVYLKNLYPDNFTAINWINQNISGNPIMLEAVGDSYTTYNQISSSTGLPTIQGWIVHEWLWRGGYDLPKIRQDDVLTIYESKNLDETKELLVKYKVEYIFVGNKEYEKYPQLNPEKFKNIGAKVVFQSGKTQIYQL
ncbi:MAG: DUF2298 domain-containing protein [Candidatus Shapirobacteria bacterium]|nr:DUF2298 domain-containing protein [Candidatus Shapirobacteria bacterium]